MRYCKLRRMEALSEELFFNILVWLPAKSLMRFKSVCKSWNALIRDPRFAQTHYTINSHTRPDSSYLLFHLVDTPSPPLETDPCAIVPANVHGIFSNQLPEYYFRCHEAPCTRLVNGLICFENWRLFQVELLNVTTLEKLVLPHPPSPEAFSSRCYCLGFDPISNQFKLIYLQKCVITADTKRYILTLSRDMSWREFPEDVNFPDISGRHICVDGAIYWRKKLSLNGERVVQYFDVAEERFRRLSIHHQVRNQSFDSEFITEIGGKFTWGGFHKSTAQITLWRLVNKHDELWVKSEIQLPKSFLRGRRNISVVGSTNTGKVLITNVRLVKNLRHRSRPFLMLFDLEKKEEKHQTCSLLRPCDNKELLAFMAARGGPYFHLTLHVENILPLHQFNKPE